VKRAVILVAGGSGSRMSASLPKQFLPLRGLPVLVHSIFAFREAYPDIRVILVLPENQIDYWQTLFRQQNLPSADQVVPGGETRFHSVKNGLSSASADLIAVHDGARPLVTSRLIRRVFETAEKHGTAIPVLPVNESLRIVDHSGSKPLERTAIRIVQTPQVFRGELLLNAYKSNYRPEFTDDATVVEYSGIPVTLTTGESYNIKITVPVDLTLAEALLMLRKT
jgi:2-C-methyl-D-erythritol 4-phosphate cytidylyltransferase